MTPERDPFGEGRKTTLRFGESVDAAQRRMTNKVRTTKYTLLTWAPLSLLY